MTLEELLERADELGRLADAGAIRDGLPREAPEDWRNLAALLALRMDDQRRTGTVLGISGGQGAGKTTLSRLLVDALAAVGLQAVALSLDDFYLTRAERMRLAQDVHPLLATRGVPGTHDAALAAAVIGTLKSGGKSRCPRFDKAADDRAPDGPTVGPGVDVVLFEGWCVGVPPQSLDALAKPLNELERVDDPDGRWRRYVNDRLTRDYPALWGLVDELVYLDVPDMQAVIRWRTEQEGQHAPGRRMDAAQLNRFVAHYERLTLWMAQVLPEIAQLVVFLDKNHGMADLRIRQAG
jgi:D-glycerate 3-kinase